MYREEVSCICDSMSLFSLADNVERFLHHVDSSQNRRKELEEAHHYVCMHEFYAKHDEYPACRVYGPQQSVLKYLTCYWHNNSSTKKEISCLYGIVSKIREFFVGIERPHISTEKIQALFDLADKKYGYTNYVIGDQKADILFLPHSHREWNSYYTATVRPKCEVLRDFIMLLSMPFDSATSPEFCFLHELGHLLHTRITKEIEKVPDSFNDFLAYIAPQTIFLEHAKAEFFADCFASSVLYDTKYEQFDELKLDGAVKNSLAQYMNFLIQQIWG